MSKIAVICVLALAILGAFGPVLGVSLKRGIGATRKVKGPTKSLSE